MTKVETCSLLNSCKYGKIVLLTVKTKFLLLLLCTITKNTTEYPVKRPLCRKLSRSMRYSKLQLFSYAKLHPPPRKRYAIEKFQPRLQLSRFKAINFYYILSHGRTLSTLVHGVAVDTFIVYFGERVSESPWKHSL